MVAVVDTAATVVNPVKSRREDRFAVDRGVPAFLDQLIAELRQAFSMTEQIGCSAARHGDDLWVLGFTVGDIRSGRPPTDTIGAAVHQSLRAIRTLTDRMSGAPQAGAY